MYHRRRFARINVKALVLLLVVAVGLLGAAYGGWKIRKRLIASRALEAGRAAVSALDWAEASKQLKLYVYRYPNDAAVMREYAEANLKVRPMDASHFGEALRAYRTLARLEPGDTETHKKLARLYAAINDYVEVAYAAEKWKGLAPDDPEAGVWLARAYCGQRKFQEAARTLREIIDRTDPKFAQNPGVVDALLLMSDVELEINLDAEDRRAKSIEWLRECAENRFPGSVKARAALARALRVQDNDWEAAREALEQASAMQGDDPTVQIVLCAEWLDHGDVEKARAHLEAARAADAAAVAEYVQDPDVWQTVLFGAEGQLALRSGEPQTCVAVADRAMSELKGSQRTQIIPTAVELYVSGGEFDKADLLLKEYRKSLEESAASLNADERLKLGRLEALVLASKGEPYAVINDLQPYLARQPRDVQAWRMMIWALDRTRQTGRLRDALKRYVQLNPADMQAQVRLADLSLAAGDWDTAIQSAQYCDAVAEYRADAEIIRIKASALRAAAAAPAAGMGGGGQTSPSEIRAEALLAQLEALRRSVPRRLDVRLMLAAVRLQQGDREKAIQELRAAIDECDEPTKAYVQLARYLIEGRKLDEAITVLTEATEKSPKESDAWIALAEVQERTQRLDEARETLKRGWEQAERGSLQRRDLGAAQARLEFRQENREAGLGVLKALLAEDDADRPDDVETRAFLLNLAEVRDDPPLANKLIDELRRIEGEAGVMWREYQARQRLGGQDWRDHQAQIEENLNFCLQADPGAETPALLLALMYERLNQVERAESIYRRALEQNPRASVAASRLFDLLARLRRTEEAAEVMKSLTAQGAATDDQRLALALGTGEYDQAIRQLEQRIVTDAKDSDSRITLARLLFIQRKGAEDVERALRLLDEAGALLDDPFPVVAIKCAILAAEKRDAEAEALIGAEVDRTGSFDAIHMRADFRTQWGKLDLAEADYQRLTAIPERGAEGALWLGRFYLMTGRQEDALAAWEAGLTSKPKDNALRTSIMGILLASKDEAKRNRGRALNEEMLKENPEQPTLLLTKAALLLEKGEPDLRRQAVQLLEKAVSLEPGLVSAHNLLIQVAVAEGQPDRAREYATRGLAANVDDPTLQLAQAKLERTLGNPVVARQIVERMLERNGRNADALRLMAELAVQLKDASSARQHIDKLAQLTPADADVQIRRAEVFAGAGDVTGAIDGLRSFLEAQAEAAPAKAMAALAELYRMTGDRDGHRSWLDKALAKDAQAPEVARAQLVALATEPDGASRFEEVASLVEARLEAHGDDVDTLLLGVNILTQSGSEELMKRGRAVLVRLAERHPQRLDVQLSAARSAYAANDRAAAAEAFGRALQIDSINGEALNGLAWLLYEEGLKLPEALDYADRAVTRDPRQPNYRDTRGNIYVKMNRLDEARRDFEECIRLAAPDSRTQVKAMMQLGRVLIEQGEKSLARQRLEAALKVDERVECLNVDERAELDALMKRS